MQMASPRTGPRILYFWHARLELQQPILLRAIRRQRRPSSARWSIIASNRIHSKTGRDYTGHGYYINVKLHRVTDGCPHRAGGRSQTSANNLSFSCTELLATST